MTDIYPFFTVPNSVFHNNVLVWFSGIWMLVLSASFQEHYDLITQYIDLCFLFWRSFSTEPILHRKVQKGTTKRQLLTHLLRVENTLLKSQLSETDVLDFYANTVFAEKIKVQFSPVEIKSLQNTVSCFHRENQPIQVKSFAAFDDVKVQSLPSSPACFGPVLWIQLFSTTFYDVFSSTQKQEFIFTICSLLPCPFCKNDSLQFLKDNKDAPFLQMVNLHQSIKTKNKEPIKKQSEIILWIHKMWTETLPLNIYFVPSQQLLQLKEFLKQRINKFSQKKK